MKKLAVKGEIITCPSGHPMFLVLEDVCVGDFVRSAMFKGLNGLPDPVGGKRLDEWKCPTCDRYSFSKQHLFVDGEPRGGGWYSPWEAQAPGTIALPDYIEGLARGTMRRINGVVHKRVTR